MLGFKKHKLENLKDDIKSARIEIKNRGLDDIKDDLKSAPAENDPYGVWNGRRFVFTLRKISQITGLEIPEMYQPVIDQPIRRLTYDKKAKVQPDRLTVIMQVNPLKNRAELTKRVQEGAIVISCYTFKDENGETLPSITLGSLREVRRVWDTIGEYMKLAFKRPTIAITGSVGKTTTTLFVQSVFSQQHKVFVSGRNRNGAKSIVGQLIRRWGPSYDYHVQEVGGAAPEVVERSARLLHPDAFIITNIFPHHLDKYKTMEGILHDKSSFERVGDEGIFGVINYDDEMLRSHDWKCRIVSFAIDNKEADYTADNIRQDGALLRFDLCKTATGQIVPISINIMGNHNVYNALAAFAVGCEMGLSDEEIVDGLAAYRSEGIRQVVREVAGRTLYIDCFNISAESIRTCLQTLESFEPKGNGRRLAVLSGENGLGDLLYDANFETGTTLSQFRKVDEFIFIGPHPDEPHEVRNFCGDGYAVYKGACETVKDKPMRFYDSLVDLATWLREETNPDDVVLFKGIFRKPMYGAIDLAFGTDYMSGDNGRTKFEPVQEGPFEGQYFPACDYTDLTGCTKAEPTLVIPSQMNGKPLHHIAEEVFRANKVITSVSFGDSLVGIGKGAFRNCRGLKSLHFPANVKFIDEKAFCWCRNVQTIEFDGIEHIEPEAFANCKALKKVVFTDSCLSIASNAFSGCANVKFVAPEGSCARAFAESHGIPCE